MTKYCKVLIVEDNQEIQELMSDVLASEGFDFVVTPDGDRALQVLEDDDQLDIAIIDRHLPRGAGALSVAAAARAAGLGVILVTGDHLQTDVLERSGHRYMLKPFRVTALMMLVDEVLAAAQRECKRRPPQPDFGAAAA